MDVEKKYWNNFYKKFKKQDCSEFCKFVIDYFKDQNTIKNVMDVGCGNGRDSYVLANNYQVTGVDNCGITVDEKENFCFKNEDFITVNKTGYDIIYSRFTFHSITNDDHIVFLNSIKSGSYLAIETRSIKSSRVVEHYGKDHYRNYTDLIYLLNILKNNNFETLYVLESNGIAVYQEEDPVCIRVIAKKN